MNANNRTYLLYEDVLKDASLKPLFDSCVDSIQGNRIHVSQTRAKKGYVSYDCFRIEGREILIEAALEYYLYTLDHNEFIYENAKDFTDLMRKLCGWRWDVDRTLRTWIEKVILQPFFEKITDEDGYPQWVLKAGEPNYYLPESVLRFACYIAVCHMKYGGGDGAYEAKLIFGYLTNIGSELPTRLKKYGSGDLPKDIAEYQDDNITCKANDILCTISITLKEENEDSYHKALDFLCRLLQFGFPKSYSIDFRSREKNWLNIKGLPKKGVHKLFANAIKWPSLYAEIEQYARLAMNEFEWYDNLQNEYCAMPGTFAVFALGLNSDVYHPLVCNYLQLCDGEHQSLQGNFVLAYIEKYGFTEKALKLYALCESNIQHPPDKLIALYKKHEAVR